MIQMKKIMTTIMIFLMIISTTLAIEEVQVSKTITQPDDLLAMVDGKLVSEDVYKPNFFERLFGGQGFNFVDITYDQKDQYLCTLKNSYGTYKWERPTGAESGVGQKCNVGEYILYNVEYPEKHIMFDNLWKKTSTSDLPKLTNYYVDDKYDGYLHYSYSCYTCQVSAVDDYEKGCLSTDKTKCVSKSSSSCGTWYGYEKVCLEHVETQSISNDLKITIDDNSIAVTNAGKLVKGQKFTVTGKAKIEGKCEGCVIETGQGYYGQALAVYSSSNGVCGDDMTVGVKFNAQNEVIEFRLTDIATKTGKYNVKIGAYNGCYATQKDNFKKLDESSFKLDVTETTASSGDNTDDSDSSNDVTCYFCKGTDLMSGTYDSSCPDGTSSDEIECDASNDESNNDVNADPYDPVECNIPGGCEDPIQTAPDYDFGSGLWNEITDFEGNPTIAFGTWIIVALVLLILGAIIYQKKK